MVGDSIPPFPTHQHLYRLTMLPNENSTKGCGRNLFIPWRPIPVLDVSPLIIRFRLLFLIHRGNNRALLLNEKRRRRRESHNAGKLTDIEVQNTNMVGPSRSVIPGHSRSSSVDDASAQMTIWRERERERK
jgi:hypothetical protein